MSRFNTLQEIVATAAATLPGDQWDYLMGAAETETTHRRNRRALDSIALRPRVLRDVTRVDQSSTLLGRPIASPVFIAPIGSLQGLHPSGALGAARAAERFGIPSFLSSVTQPGLEEIAGATKHPKVFQLYVKGDRAWVADHVGRAKAAGYAGICFTVDTQVYSRRERDLLKGYVPLSQPRGGRAPGDSGGWEFQSGMTWDFVDWYKERFDLPLVLKGIATGEDALLAVEHGANVVYVSNHGGRQLDHGAATIEFLPEVVDAVAGRAEVVVDGGFYRGTDIVKAIACGANAVGIGRLYGAGLAAAGEEGVHRVLEILADEIRIAMSLLGVRSLAELDRRALRPATPVDAAPAFANAFPHWTPRERKY